MLCIILILRPYKIIDIGLYLSFLGAISIIYSNILITDIKKVFDKVFNKIHVESSVEKIKKFNKNILLSSIIRIYGYYYIYKEKIELLKTKYELKEINKNNKKYSKIRIKDIMFKIQKINIYLLEKIISITIIAILNSIAVSIIIMPVMWYNFGIINLNFIFANILLLPIFGIIIVLGLIYLMFYPILSIVNKYIFKESFLTIICMIIDKSISLLLCIISKLQKLNFLNLTLAIPKFLTILLFYLILIYIYLKIRDNIDKNIDKEYINEIGVLNILKNIIIILLIICISLNIFTYVFNLKRNTISFVDIGQGDSSVIITKDNMNIVIDCGEGESPRYPAGKKILYPYLLKKGITKIDYLIISHFDSDHSGGAKNIIKKLEVKNLIIGRQDKISKQYINIIESAKKKNVKIIYVKKGDKFKIGKYVKIDIMFPEIKQISQNPLNNNSVVALVEVLKSNNYFNINRYRHRYNNMYKYNEVKKADIVQTDNFNKIMYKSKAKYIPKNLKILYTGDIEKIAEDKIVENIKHKNNKLDIDILKSAHHGSNSSSTIQFLEQFNITAFVISCGKNNNFSHPSKIVLKRYEEIIKNINNKKRKKQIQLLSEISRTDREGEIIYIN